jgi:hypothetical protein
VPGYRKGKVMESGLFVFVQSSKKLSRICVVSLLNFATSTVKGSTKVDVVHKTKLKKMLFENSLATTQKTRPIFTAMTNHVILFREKVTLFCEITKKKILLKLSSQNERFEC